MVWKMNYSVIFIADNNDKMRKIAYFELLQSRFEEYLACLINLSKSCDQTQKSLFTNTNNFSLCLKWIWGRNCFGSLITKWCFLFPHNSLQSLYCNEKRSGEKFGLSDSYLAIGETGEAIQGVLDSKVNSYFSFYMLAYFWVFK